MADERGQDTLALASEQHRKATGQFFTPLRVAQFMASLVVLRAQSVRILDPGAGSGVLSCSVCEQLASLPDPPTAIHIDAFEPDANLADILEGVMDELSAWLRDRDIELSSCVRREDFVRFNETAFNQNGILWSEGIEPYDLVISNPPYFKVAKDSHYARIASSIVHGQPNMYSIFMAAGAALLREGGQLVFITPRSFASGAYFRRFRRVFFHTVRPLKVHLFDSRKKAFDRDEVLQEWVILSALREPGWYRQSGSDEQSVAVSSSSGAADLGMSRSRDMAVRRILDMHTDEAFFRIPLTGFDDLAVDVVDSWGETLGSLGLEISTGRVVPFRATRHLRREEGASTAPLVWMNNVVPMELRWPLHNHKPEHIEWTSDTEARLLSPDANYILLRRFSSKEQARRLIAAPLMEGTLGHPWVGLENHVNYIYSRTGAFEREVLVGLAVLLNSTLLDTYFRVLNGNTEVSATEIRATPLPEKAVLIVLGQRWQPEMSLEDLDEVVGETLGMMVGSR
jgi:adenine-specific DNA-methyltransferase